MATNPYPESDFESKKPRPKIWNSFLSDEERREALREDAANALEYYRISNGLDTNAGHDIMRYADKGYYEVIPGCERVVANMFMNWYPRNQAFTVLRLVDAGYLRCKDDQTGLKKMVKDWLTFIKSTVKTRLCNRHGAN